MKYLVSVEHSERPSCEGEITSKTTSRVYRDRKPALLYIKAFLRRLKRTHGGLVIHGAVNGTVVVEKRFLNNPWSIRWVITLSKLADDESPQDDLFSFFQLEAGETIEGYRCVVVNNDKLYKAGILDYRAVGLLTDGVEEGQQGTVQLNGVVTNDSWNWTAGLNVVMDADGGLTQETDDGMPLVIAGKAVTTTSVNIGFTIIGLQQ